MAIYHLSMKPITRASGRSAVAAAAYRSGTRLVNERDGLTHDFTRKSGIEHSEIVLPDDANADWANDRSALWNAAEFAENRKDARVAREFELALPHELTADERLELTREFSKDLANRYSAAVDFAIHSPDGDTDIRNHHAHVLMTTRQVTQDGLGDKTLLERENKYLMSIGEPTSHDQLRDIRLEWEQMVNEHLARAGHDIRVDHRSHSDRGLEIEPTRHMGVHATQMDQRGIAVERTRLDTDTARKNADLIREHPEHVLKILTDEKSVFDKRDIARTLHRYLNDDATEYHNALTSVMGSKQLVKLRDAGEAGDGSPAKYSTKEMVEIETGMMRDAQAMHDTRNHAIEVGHYRQAVDRQTHAIRQSYFDSIKPEIIAGKISREDFQKNIEGMGLSDEQKHAVAHVNSPQQIAVVVGYAGAGKSTMLAAAREAWEAQGYNVHGAALAGKAAEGLEESSGIASRTLASWEYHWKRDAGRLTKNDVLVIDEAGMVGSKQLSGFIEEARHAGAKIVLVGDHEQLQAIGAGAAFRSVAETVGFAELKDVRRQHEPWQRDASVALASHRTQDALKAYDKHGAIDFADTRDEARAFIVEDYVADLKARPHGSRAAMAHRKADVRELNDDIRQALKDEGLLQTGEGKARNTYEPDHQEHVYQTNDGLRAFVAGDRFVFLENDKKLGVKNGMLGTVTRADDGRLEVELDGKGRSVAIDPEKYKAFDHGYATTIHKTQGATVDKAYVLASKSMDRHLTYVAMTRHRQEARLYAGADEFAGMDALSQRLSRSGAKETTIDYTHTDPAGFAARRGVEREGGEAYMGESLAPRHDGHGGPSRHGTLDISRVDGGDNHGGSVAHSIQPEVSKTRAESGRPDANARADAVIDKWRELSALRSERGDRMLYGERAKLERDMRGLAQAVKDDPAVEAVIKARVKELGLGQGTDNASPSRQMEREIRRDRDRDLER